MIKISVFIVSYNQEKYIAQAIESVLQQSVKPYEIIISDDCSKDDTWNIIQQYRNQYPDLIKAFRNDPNLGVFRNFNETTRRATGNLITCVAGDDFIMPGYFEHISKCIEENQLDPDIDNFIIIPNVINLFENGIKRTYNNMQFKDKNILQLRLRGGIIDDRYGVVSRASLDNTGEFLENIGIHADYVWGIDRYIHTDKFYFIDGYYPVYRQGIGIVSRTKEIDASKSLIESIKILIARFEGYLNCKDVSFLYYLKIKSEYMLERSFVNYLHLVYSTILNFDNFGTPKKLVKALTFILLPYRLKMLLFKIKYVESLSK